MFPAYDIPSARRAAAAVALAALLLAPVRPAGALEEATPAQRLTGQAARPVRDNGPASLRLSTPGGLWAAGEASLDEEVPATGSALREASLALGLRREVRLLPALASSFAPQFRVEAGAPGAAPALGAVLQQEVALSLPRGASLTASVALADRVAGGALMLRGHAAFAAGTAVGGMPVHASLEVDAGRMVADHGPERAGTCQIALALRWGGAPIRLAGSCPGEAAPRVTIGISAAF